mgnify:CR=1 FL=1
MGKITIPYKARIWATFHETKKRWIVLVLHRRAGKSTAAFNHLQRDALTTPNSRFAYISPTYKQGKNIIWDIAKHYARIVPRIEFNEAELTVKYPNGSKITLYGADNPDSLRGIGLWGVVFDEYSQQPSNIFTEIIRPALADHQGYAIWIGTPKGKNEFYKLFKYAQQDPDWFAMLQTVDDTELISEQELKDAKKIMTSDEFQQEWYCSFEAAIKGAIFADELAQARKDKRITIVPYDTSLPVFTVWDLGKGANMAIGFYQRSFEQVRKIDYWEGQGNDSLPEAIKVVKNKPYVYGGHFAPHDIVAVDLSTGKTRLETAEELGISFEKVPKLEVNDRINAGKLMFSRLWVDENKCEKWLENIGQFQREWDAIKGMFRDNPLHDFASHGADEYTYAAVIEKNMINTKINEERQILINRFEREQAKNDYGLN